MPDSSTVDTFNQIRQSEQLEEMGKRIDKLGQSIMEISSTGRSSTPEFEKKLSDVEKKLTPIQHIYNIMQATKKTVEEVQRSSISKTSVVHVFESEKKLILEEVKQNSTKFDEKLNEKFLDMQRNLQQSLQREYKESITQLSRSFHEALNSSLTQMTATFNANLNKMKEEIKAEITTEVKTEMKAEFLKEKAEVEKGFRESQAIVQRNTKSIKECLIENMRKQDAALMTHITNCTRYYCHFLPCLASNKS